MRVRLQLILAITLFATSAFAKDVYLAIGGSVGSFRTDTRIFNPSTTNDIQIQAYLLPVGNVDNTGVQAKAITIPKRSMVEYDDVVSSLFGATGLGGIRLSSSDDFVATQRVYSTAGDGSTNGQFVEGVDSANALTNGVIIQMKSNGTNGQARTFRTNLGLVNPNSTAANVTWRVYDKNNNQVGQPFTQKVAPLGVVQPLPISAFQNSGTPAADLTDTWISFSSDQPIIAYGSVIDNLNNAGTYVAAVAPTIGMQLARSPTGLQRRQEYVNAIGVEPDHVPVPTDSVWSTVFVPPGRIGGVAVFFGAIVTTGAVTSEFCSVLPPESVAVTATRSREPLSAGAGAYVERVAPGMATQMPLTGSPGAQRFHW